MSIPYVYDAGALIALDNNDRRMWVRHAMALEEGRDIHVPAVVVSQAWRDGRRQVRLGHILSSCRIEPVRLEIAKAAGTLCGKSGTSDVVDATVVAMAALLGATIWTSDPGDIRRLADAADVKPGLVIRTV
ncbi:type II toxin-antitoxin system VapC family toxin [Kitasatospora viridis]|uniref:PIN domain-containing protein n=1 Tax=Kitasatospora viridis TaxID=281105 RepID=A0A561UBT8_9ACTN|nr:PIN domain-containing protein [Kitasatospora viridis]TWF96832.1 PIN domain-containing protein [Kitasatospora viridis]